MKRLPAQLADFQNQAQQFNQKLAEYRRLDDALKDLQLQAKTVNNQLVEQEVSKPFDAKISILEPPFTPEFPVGPNYWQDTLISIIAAIVCAIAALLLFSFIVRRSSPNLGSTNFVVLPGEQRGQSYAELQGAHQAQLEAKAQALRLGEQQSHQPQKSLQPQKGHQPQQGIQPQQENIRLLTTDECQALYGVANKQAKAVIGLMLSGVNATELRQITKADCMIGKTKLNITGAYARQIPLAGQLITVLEQLCEGLKEDDLLWLNPLSIEDFNQLIINAAHDAELPYPEQLSGEVLRHTYLTYLVSQGVRLNDLEQLAGYLKPAELGKYRTVNRHGKSLDIEQANTMFPYF
ncbi:tyrosine-type recombinase/integrase [Paraglaciecola sp. T6c]|uniref:tyrosine-type recombinase/integrase n=1 Tax=Pseudoalteromonas atlantica (strain T6c / ATCC BAA-1087) TaxID=3042615 RepID=UPI001E2A6CA7|nr:tyrosine-type recombinase/integrase [Paraglaciecola sp. T6c]